MTAKQWIVLCSVAVISAPLHWLAVQWLSERPMFCKDKVEALTDTREFECGYPRQRVALEQGMQHKLAVCRCP